MIAERTRFALHNLLIDVKKIYAIFSYVLYGVFFIFYGFSIYSTINKLPFLIIYCILCFLTLLSLIFFLIKNKENKETIRKINRIKNFFKYAVLFTMLVVNVVEMLKFGTSDFNKIMLFVSGLFLVIQIIFEFVTMFVEKYVKVLTDAIQKDFEFIHPTTWKRGALRILDAPLEKLARKKSGEEKEENHSFDEFVETVKKTNKQKEKDKRKKEIEQIKTHVNTIFKKKEK
ncbi:MAG: hypothetical protein E7342_01130 [Clostridiales bacterium]|nr:hypothetical protein [Clostridiales bacterium]